MTISIENYVEQCIWNEWTNRIKSINNHYIRKHFYPNNIEFINNLSIDFEKLRRDSVKEAISYRLVVELNYHKLTTEEKRLFSNKTTEIKNLDKKLEEFLINKKEKEYINQIRELEKERMNILYFWTSDRLYKAFEKNMEEKYPEFYSDDLEINEGAKILLDFSKKVHEEYNNKKSDVPLRRSTRLKNKK